jgi:hypothetical protein
LIINIKIVKSSKFKIVKVGIELGMFSGPYIPTVPHAHLPLAFMMPAIPCGNIFSMTCLNHEI